MGVEFPLFVCDQALFEWIVVRTTFFDVFLVLKIVKTRCRLHDTGREHCFRVQVATQTAPALSSGETEFVTLLGVSLSAPAFLG